MNEYANIAEVNAWWSELSSGQQDALRRQNPETKDTTLEDLTDYQKKVLYSFWTMLNEFQNIFGDFLQV